MKGGKLCFWYTGSTSVAYVGKLGGFWVERVLLLVHIGFVGVHSSEVGRRGVWYKRGVL